MDLLDAVVRGDVATVAALLQSGADANSRNNIGSPALCVAAIEGHVAVAELLLAAGAAVDDELHMNHETALTIAARGGPVALVHLLLGHGADVNHGNGMGTALHAAISVGDVAIVDELLAAGANVHAVDTDRHRSPLLVAADKGIVAMAARLLDNGAMLSDVDKDGFGAVYFAAQEGHVDMIRFLVVRGADPNVLSHAGYTPLYTASGCGRVDAVATLLDVGADVNLPQANHCLIAAAAYGDLRTVSLLLDAGAHVNAADAKGVTALIAAAITGHADVARQLAYARAKLDVSTCDEQTPVMLARAHGHANVLSALQDVRTKKMKLLHAARHGDVGTVRALFAEGLSANETDEHGNTLLHLATLGRHEALVAALLQDPTVELDQINKFGESPRAIAAKLGLSSLLLQLHAAQVGKMSPMAHEVAARSTVHLQELGRGGYGIVFKDTLLGQDVALKMLVNSSSKAKNLRYEIEILKNNPSPYLVRLLATADAASDATQLFFEYMDGGNLTSYLEMLANDEPVPVVYTPIEILWVVANALHDLHAKNVVHRDIKTDNILLSSKHYIKVGDVGIAKKESKYMTTGAGTNKWRAPEVLTSGSRYGTPADIYSFGILLQTLYPNPTDPSTEWAQALAADCTAVDPTRRPTAAKLISILLPKLQSQPDLVASLPAFEKDRAAGPRLLETLVPQMQSSPVQMNEPVFAPIRLGRSGAPLSPEEELHSAVQAGDFGAARSLLERGVHPDCAGVTRETPLMLAVRFGHVYLVELLLQYGANVNVASIVRMTALHEAARQSSPNMLRRLLRVPTIAVDPLSRASETPLHMAVAAGQSMHAMLLWDAGADLEAADTDGNRPLHYAAIIGDEATVAVLLRLGAQTAARNGGGEMPLHSAILRQHGRVATRLVEAGVDTTALYKGQSPLHLACEYGVADVVPALLVHGVNVNAKHDGVSPLYMAIVDGHTSVVAALIAAQGIDLHERDENGATLVHVAARKGYVDMVATLLQAGVDYDLPETTGLRALDVFAWKDNDAMVEVFRSAYQHRRALLQAVHQADVARLSDLLQARYSCNVVDAVGCSLVHLAVAARNEVVLDALLARPDVRCGTRNHMHQTPLAIAIEWGDASMATKLFDRTARAVVEIAASEYDVTTAELGVGGYGTVLLGSYLGEKVAVKKFRHTYHRTSFAAEVDALLKCRSPYLVQLVAIAGQGSETPALLFEYMDGGNLRTHLEQKRWHQRTVVHVTNLRVAWVVANALRDLHAAKLVHRDVKSENVLLSTSGGIRLGDLGLTRLEATDMTEAPGTRYWMAPEILQAEGAVYGCPADIYAFGVLLTELATCQLPYFDHDVQDPIAFARGVINGTLRPTLTTECEPWLQRLVTRCLRGDPTARPTADQIVAILQDEMTATAAGMSVAETYMRAVAKDDANLVAQMLSSSLSLRTLLPGALSLLHAAAAAGATDTVQLLLARGADVNDATRGRTPLHEAARRRFKHVLRLLIDAGADVDAQDHEGKTPLVCALGAASLSCITQLLATGADVRQPAMDGITPLKIVHANKFLVDVLPLLTAAASPETSGMPTIFCGACGNWHLVEAKCAICNYNAPSIDRQRAVIRRLVRLHHRSRPVNWLRTCTACHETSMTIVDDRCPQCAHTPKDANPLRRLYVRLKLALRSTATCAVPRMLSEIPKSVLRWLTHAPPQNTQPLSPDVAFLKYDLLRYEQMYPADADPERVTDLVTSLVNSSTAIDRSLWASATLAGQSMLVRASSPLVADPVPTLPVACLLAPGVVLTVHGQDLVHRLISNESYLEAIARCPSPFLESIVAVARPASVLVLAPTGLSLADWMRDSGDVVAAARMRVPIAICVAKALADVHAHGLVHGYLTSHNVYWTAARGIRVSIPGASATNEALLAWTAPEVLAGDTPPSFAADMYAFGVLLTELDTFSLACKDDDASAIPTTDVAGVRPALRDDCDVWIRSLGHQCLQADPRRRPAAAEVVEQLHRRFGDDLREV
ncbi:TKL protein kinase [Saprolegnia diclina VS20]|uniref:TKL protein kinase n=1 Tax=Saprolegnia diclina (strain VS20) TaxID=1156394 RepID=T0QE97_SAPDV|nr:TKL protein kinase [Saprolegnia diclina VS20]EQC31885.1 TKL protein kinase [Saprolegnia diclina VS20]|eukprot:XP_008614613.1 TKL protein kinase [Saprolegnia diclina VS20]